MELGRFSGIASENGAREYSYEFIGFSIVLLTNHMNLQVFEHDDQKPFICVFGDTKIFQTNIDSKNEKSSKSLWEMLCWEIKQIILVSTDVWKLLENTGADISRRSV